MLSAHLLTTILLNLSKEVFELVITKYIRTSMAISNFVPQVL